MGASRKNAKKNDRRRRHAKARKIARDHMAAALEGRQQTKRT
jgi:hypothetical protein